MASKVQILATEHWSLLATRALTYQESLGRVNMFLAILSGAVIALALVGVAIGCYAVLGQRVVVGPAILLLPAFTVVAIAAALAVGLWLAALNVSGPLRALRMGTFGVTAYSALGAESLHPISPLTTTLTYGVIAPDGGVTVRVVYDHRVLDGATVARALVLMEAILCGQIVRELEALAGQTAAA